MDETWRAAVGFEASHEVSNLGRVRTIARRQRVLRPNKMPDGYLRMTLSFEGRQPRRAIHRLVAEAFLGPAPPSRHQINHKDGDKANNRVENLEWCSPSENGVHAYANNLSTPRKGSQHGRSKLTDAQVAEIKSLGGQLTQRAIAERFGVRQPQIYRILAGKRWAHVD